MESYFLGVSLTDHNLDISSNHNSIYCKIYGFVTINNMNIELKVTDHVNFVLFFNLASKISKFIIKILKLLK